jgi:hypothetical protein
MRNLPFYRDPRGIPHDAVDNLPLPLRVGERHIQKDQINLTGFGFLQHFRDTFGDGAGKATDPHMVED